jgi:hypothetical protein
MNKIIDLEKIVIDTESREFLLKISKHSIRSLVNHLERIYIYGEPVDIGLCKKLCSHISFDKFEETIVNVREKKLSEAIVVLFSIHDYGYSVIDILDYFFNFVKQTKTMNEDEKYKVIPVICKYITIFHNVHEDAIELALFINDLYNVLKTYIET